MTISLLDQLPEVFVSTSETTELASRAVRQGRLRKLASRVYTRNLTDAPEAIVRRHLWPLVGALVPGAIIADRTALENQPASDGSVFVIATHKRDITLPGITIKPRKGPPALDGDRPFIGGLRLASTVRAYLENMATSRPRAGQVGRTLRREELEARLEAVLRRNGPEALGRLRDEARQIAGELDLAAEFAALDRLIGALLGTREDALTTPQGKARRRGSAMQPFDPERVALFEQLHGALRSWPPVTRPARDHGTKGNATLAFFEAYFSNFIEGTEFAVEEAADIVFRGVIPRERPEDAHDVLGTWRLVSDLGEMRRTASSAADFLALLRHRHTVIMAGRPDMRPGHFKTAANRAGATLFVAPELVPGTLAQGFEWLRSLETPFARAVFMMFLVSEVHPFTDGNGRTARIMMNAELVGAGEARIIIPTVYRANYLSGLKALSLNGHSDALIRILDFAQKWTAAISWGELEVTRQQLAGCNAFLDAAEAEQAGTPLRLP